MPGCLHFHWSIGPSRRRSGVVAPSWRAYQEACPWPRGSRGAARPCTPLMPYAHSIFSSLLIDPMAFVHAIGSLDDLGDGESLPLLAVKVKDLKRLYVLCTYGRCTSVSTSRPPFTARQLPRCRPRSWGSFIAGGTTGTGVVKIQFWHQRLLRQGVLFMHLSRRSAVRINELPMSHPPFSQAKRGGGGGGAWTPERFEEEPAKTHFYVLSRTVACFVPGCGPDCEIRADTARAPSLPRRRQTPRGLPSLAAGRGLGSLDPCGGALDAGPKVLLGALVLLRRVPRPASPRGGRRRAGIFRTAPETARPVFYEERLGVSLVTSQSTDRLI